jgi:hypothetical protein
MWCIPPGQDAAFVCQMEQVLEVYKRPYDPRRPVVGMDEQPKQLIAEVRPPIPAAPGRPGRVDFEYVREGVCVAWMFVEPLAGWRGVSVTDTKTALYQAFEPAEALRIATKLELVHTPKHGSWLNVAEPELSVLTRQCLDRRISSRDEVAREARAWDERRNTRQVGVEWQFTTEDARIKLKHLYPKVRE